MNVFLPFLCVAAGGAAGSVLRYAVALLVNRWAASAFPFGTLAVNVAGSFLIGLLMVAVFHTTALKTPDIRENVRLLMVTGVLGGFTTFSSFSWETWKLISDGRVAWACANVLATVAVCLLFTVLGAALGAALTK